jgi:C4-dicarboxylate transporter, DctQ subunit
VAQALSRTLTRIENVLAVLSIAFLFAVVALITYDVLGRRVIGTSLPWIVEVSEYFLLFATFMNSAWVLREHGHIAVDFIDRFLSERGLKTLRISAYLLTFITTIYLLYFASRLGLDYYERQTLQGNFILVPQWIMYAPIPVGLTLFLIELGRQFSRFLRGEEIE